MRKFRSSRPFSGVLWKRMARRPTRGAGNRMRRSAAFTSKLVLCTLSIRSFWS